MEALEGRRCAFPSLSALAGKDHCMADNDDFDLWLGRIGRNTPAVGKSLARARRAGGHGSVAGRRFTGARLGRGNGIGRVLRQGRSEEHTSELQSLMRISYAVFCLKKKKYKHSANIINDISAICICTSNSSTH